MYCRVVHIKFVSEIQMKMVTTYMEHTMLPRNLAAGQISGEVFKISETEVFTVSKHKNKTSADKVMALMPLVDPAQSQFLQDWRPLQQSFQSPQKRRFLRS